MSDIPMEAVEQFPAYCATAVPQHVLDKLRVESTVEGNAITIWEVRPPWSGDTGTAWERSPCAQFRYNPANRKWKAFWPNRDEKWLDYPQLAPTTSVDRLIDELERDPYCCFWG